MAEQTWVGEVGFMVKGGRYWRKYPVRAHGSTRSSAARVAVVEAEKALKAERGGTRVTEMTIRLTRIKTTTS